MFILGVGTASPTRRYTQSECWEIAQHADQIQRLSARSRAVLRKVLMGKNGIEARHLVLDDLGQVFDLRPDALHARFANHAPQLAQQAATRALRNAGEDPQAIDGLIVSTCTGYLCPGLTSYVAESLGLRPEVLALDLVGQGCGAALPNLRTAEALLSSNRCTRVLSVCVEICSAAFYLDDDPGVLVSACLFGDGAGAAILGTRPNGNRRMEWRAASSFLDPRRRDLLRFELKEGLLRNILTPGVPALAAEQVSRVLANVLNRTGVKQTDISGWILHPGGRDVLLAVADQLGLEENQLRWSRAVLREYGNLSSASVFFVLQEALGESPPGGFWWMSSFGAGFSAHGALLAVE